MTHITDYHAQCKITDNPDEVFDETVFTLQEEYSFGPAHPDFLSIKTRTLLIDDARGMKEWASRRALTQNKICIICTNSIAHEAQNALLKLFEEPQKYTYFYIITSTDSFLLPTLRSRMSIEKMQSSRDEERKLATEFLSSHLAKRLSLLESLIKEKDVEGSIVLLSQLERIFHEKIGEDRKIETAHLSRDLMKKRGYLLHRSSSLKTVLEGLAITLPRE